MWVARSWRCLVAGGALSCLAASAIAQEPIDTELEDEWVIGNLVFLAYHEVGHLLLDQVVQVDQLSNRLAAEQSADDIATWLISPDPGEEIESSEAVAAIGGWLEMADRDGIGDADTPHLPDADLYPDAVTRASRIACLLLGSDESSPNAFAELEPFAALRFEASACRQTYLTLDRSMEEIFGDAEDFSDAPVARVRVQHDPAAPALSEARDFLIASGILMGLRDDLIEYVGLPVDVLLRGASCGSGSPGFMYNPTRKEIIACYEEVDWFLFGEPAAQTRGRSDADGNLGSRPRAISPLQQPPPPPPPDE